MLSEGGAEISADNVAIQEVVVTESDILDVTGSPRRRRWSCSERAVRGSCEMAGSYRWRRDSET